VEATTIDRMPREFVRGRRSNLRVVLRGENHASADLDGFVERTRSDVFALYATVREAQRETGLPASKRLRMLGTASERAARISRSIDAFAATMSAEDDRGFGVPI
jgi:hypothetical protein